MRIDGTYSSISSTGSEMITSRILDNEQPTKNYVTNFTISFTTKYPEEWNKYLTSKFKSVNFINNADLDGYEHPYNYQISEQPNKIDTNLMDVTVHAWCGDPENKIILDYSDTDIITTIGTVIVSPTPTPIPSATPTADVPRRLPRLRPRRLLQQLRLRRRLRRLRLRRTIICT